MTVYQLKIELDAPTKKAAARDFKYLFDSNGVELFVKKFEKP